jgi:hypothetical protein
MIGQYKMVAKIATLLALSMAFLAGCSANLEAVLPTARPTLTAVPPTNTRIIPTNIPTSTAPVFVPPTITPGPSPTPLFLVPATSVGGAPAPTTAAVLPGSLQIEYFTANKQTVAIGETVTLFWSMRGVDSGIIYRLDEERKRIQSWDVPRVGSLQVDVTNDQGEVATFLLFIGNNNVFAEQTVSVQAGCVLTWFFSPGPGGCPPAPAASTIMVQQAFEGGFMFWVQAQGRIYVLFNEGRAPRWESFTDAYQDGQPESDPSLSPPEGRSQPIRGFGLLWRTNQGLRERLGWATAPEQAYDGQIQGEATTAGGIAYLRDKEGGVIALEEGGNAWRRIGG